MKKILFSIFIMMFFVGGCNQDTEIKSINDVNIKDLQEYNGTQLGDNSAVSSIISSLPGGSTYREFELTDQSIQVIYGLRNESPLTEEEFSNYWLNEDTIEKNFLYNAAAIFILIKNADNVTLEVDSEKYYSFSISRVELEKELPHLLNKYAEDEKIWENDILNNLIKFKGKRQGFFKKYPIKQS